MATMNDLQDALDQLPYTYDDFVNFCVSLSEESQENLDKLVDFMRNTEDVTASDVVEFISDVLIPEDDEDFERDPDEEYDDDEE